MKNSKNIKSLVSIKEIMGIPISAITLKETVQFIQKSIEEKRRIHHVVVNAGKIVSMKKNRSLFNSVINAELINADGQAVIWASKFLSKPLPERVERNIKYVFSGQKKK